MVKKGFTLAEVMVTLGILGVLAAILIPAIVKTTPDNNKIMFKKAYYTLEGAINTMINDDAAYPAMTDLTTGLERGFNFTDARLNDTLNKFCFYLSDELNTVPIATSTPCPGVADTGVSTFTTSDGIIWNVYIPASDADPNAQFPLNPPQYAVTVTVDVNGSKTPNCSEDALTNPTVSACATGTEPDTFQIGVRYDGKLNIPLTDSTATSILADPLNYRK